MKKLEITLLLFFIIHLLSAQSSITGIIHDQDGEVIIGANIFLKDTYDGTSSELDGRFVFETIETGKQVLVVSYLGYETLEKPIEISGDSLFFTLSLKSASNQLAEVVISAGAFEASDEKKAVMLRSLDIVTTAGATADIAGALNTLPGTQTVGEEGKLFVRGGAAHETATFIDGMRIQNPYSSSVPSIPARGRFSPFLFKGTTFSTGGYSAEYGQALSSALILETIDLAPKTVTGVSLMSVGLGVAHTERWDSTSLSASLDYTNLAPYTAIAPQNMEWEDPFQGYSGQLIFRHQPKENSILKIQANGTTNHMKMRFPDMEEVTRLNPLQLDNDNYFGSISYQTILDEKWTWFVGGSYTFNEDRITEKFDLKDQEQSTQFKSTLSYHLNDQIKLKSGVEYWWNDWSERFISAEADTFQTRLKDHYTAGFMEADIYLSSKLAGRVGLRAEYDHLLQQFRLAPRFSLAYQTSKNAQVSLAYGQFYQNPQKEWLRYGAQLDMERADHLMLNYQILTKERTFRIEAYWKQYHQLVKFPQQQPWAADNEGQGYARGVDVFYRDKKTIKNGDFWLSYSFLDTKRDYLDFPEASRPGFASAHNFSAVYKHWINEWSSNVGVTYSYGSPRSFDDPNEEAFNQERTMPYHDLSLNWSYLTHWWGHFTIVYVSVTNVPGFKQQFGQRFSNQPNEEGQFTSMAVRPPAKRFFFVGLFLSIE